MAVVAGQAPTDTASRLVPVVREVERIGRSYGDSIWPGFRPDTIPLSYVIPARGNFLHGWRGDLPAGYSRIAGAGDLAWRDLVALGAASTGTTIEGRPVAQIVMSSLNEPELVSLAIHEAFHVYQGVSRKPGRLFGNGENSFFVSSYPIFGLENETGFALEAAILGAALDATTTARRRALAQQFISVRRARHAAMPSNVSQFDQQSEMNEGLAQYAQVRALQLLERHGPAPWRAGATQLLKAERRRVSEIMTNTTQSFRLRYYATGPSMGLLMDPIAGARWKRLMLDENLTLQDAMGAVSGVDSVARAARTRAEADFDLPARRREAVALMDRVRERRLAQVDSLLGVPGITLVIAADSLPTKEFGICLFDPQNHLQVSATKQLQTRMWIPCIGRAVRAELNVPSVYDTERSTVTAVIGSEADVKLTIDGQPRSIRPGDVIAGAVNVKLDAPRVAVTAAKATITRVGDRILIRLLP